jgi:hypothetical protein
MRDERMLRLRLLLTVLVAAMALGASESIIRLQVSPDQLSLESGQAAALHVNITNSGDDPARSLKLYASGTLARRLPDIAPKSSYEFTYNYTAQAPGTIVLGLSVRRAKRELVRRDVIIDVLGEVLPPPERPTELPTVTPNATSSPDTTVEIRPPPKPARKPGLNDMITPGPVIILILVVTLGLVLMPHRERGVAMQPRPEQTMGYQTAYGYQQAYPQQQQQQPYQGTWPPEQ